MRLAHALSPLPLPASTAEGPVSGTCCEVDCLGGQVTNLQLQQLKIRRDGGNALSTTRGIDRRWAIGSIQCAIRIIQQIAQGNQRYYISRLDSMQLAVLQFPLELHAASGTRFPA